MREYTSKKFNPWSKHQTKSQTNVEPRFYKQLWPNPLSSQGFCFPTIKWSYLHLPDHGWTLIKILKGGGKKPLNAYEDPERRKLKKSCHLSIKYYDYFLGKHNDSWIQCLPILNQLRRLLESCEHFFCQSEWLDYPIIKSKLNKIGY